MLHAFVVGWFSGSTIISISTGFFFLLTSEAQWGRTSPSGGSSGNKFDVRGNKKKRLS